MQKFQINLGKTLPAFRGEWDSETNYSYNDIVTRYQSSYVCVSSITNVNHDPYLDETYDDGGVEKHYWRLLAGRGVKGAKWFVGEGPVTLSNNLETSTEESNIVTYYNYDSTNLNPALENGVAQVGDYYLDVSTGNIYICIYPGVAAVDVQGESTDNDASIWKYVTEFNWLEKYQYFYIKTTDFVQLLGETNRYKTTTIYRYNNEHNLEALDLTDEGLDPIDIENARFNCSIAGTVSTQSGQELIIQPINENSFIEWNDIVRIEIDGREIDIATNTNASNYHLWIQVEQYSIMQTTSSFTFNNMTVGAESLEWNESATVTTGYVLQDDIKVPKMIFGIPRGKPFSITEVVDGTPDQAVNTHENGEIILAKSSTEDVYHYFSNSGTAISPVWKDLGRLSYPNFLVFKDIDVDVEEWEGYNEGSFLYRWYKNLDDLEEDMIPFVTLPANVASDYKISSLAEIKIIDDLPVLVLYADELPPENFQIKTLVCLVSPYFNEVQGG